MWTHRKSQSLNVWPKRVDPTVNLSRCTLNPLRLNYIDQTAGGIFGKSARRWLRRRDFYLRAARIGAEVDGLDMGDEP